MSEHLPELCGREGCRKIRGHSGRCRRTPSEAWSFFEEKDRNKIAKAGFATPRGGRKGAYQNHVVRSSKVILPYEKFSNIDPSVYADGYVVRLFPEQYFSAPHTPRSEFLEQNTPIRIGDNAFILYRTHDSWEQLPPMVGWEIRRLLVNGVQVSDRQPNAVDAGHYVLRLSTADGARLQRVEGPPQGIFAPEYADSETNYLCKCVLAWLIIHMRGSPYTASQALHLRAILKEAGLEDAASYEFRNVLRHGLSCCPLCLRILHYRELHDTVAFEDEASLANAGVQVEGSTRSTIVNLFHLDPLAYGCLKHAPNHVGWGHAVCNTRLGQRRCYSLPELQEMDLKIGILRDENIETFGWISRDFKMIRSPNGAVWIQLNEDTLRAEDGEEKAGPPPSTEELVDGTIREEPSEQYPQPRDQANSSGI